MKLTIMQACSTRCSRVNRTNWRPSTSPLGIGALLDAVFGGGLFKLSGGFLFRRTQLPPHLESSWQPEQRMNATDHKCSQQQPGHAPKGIKHKRIFFRIVMRGVRQVSG